MPPRIAPSMGATAPGGGLIAEMVQHNVHRRIVSEALSRYDDTNAAGRLDRITGPTLVIHGDQDHPGIASIANLLVANIPNVSGETTRRLAFCGTARWWRRTSRSRRSSGSRTTPPRSARASSVV